MTTFQRPLVDFPYLHSDIRTTAACREDDERNSFARTQIYPIQDLQTPHAPPSSTSRPAYSTPLDNVISQLLSPPPGSRALSRSRNTSIDADGTWKAQSKTLAGTKRLRSGVSTAQADEYNHLATKRAKFCRAVLTGTHSTVICGFAPGVRTDEQNLVGLETRAKRYTAPLSDLTLSLAAAKMLAHSEDNGRIKTVKLARGQASNPARPPGSASGRNSSEQYSRSLSARENTIQNNAQILADVGILELLQQDERPTFIIDVADAANLQSGFLNLIFANTALKIRPSLLEHVRGVGDDSSQATAIPSAFVEFKRWATSFVKEGEALTISLPTYSYAGSIWTSSTLRKRIRVIACDPSYAPVTLTGSSSQSDLRLSNGLSSSSLGSSETTKQELAGYFDQAHSAQDVRTSTDAASLPNQDSIEALSREQSRGFTRVPSIGTNGDIESMEVLMSPGSLKEQTEPYQPLEASDLPKYSEAHNIIPDQGFFDWTRLPESSAFPPHIRFARSVNWAATSLGPIENWDSDLRAMCNLIMASPHPAAMYWGPDLIAIYNEAYILLAGNKHPALMGQSYMEAWGEIWDAVKDVFASAISSAQATMKDDDRLFMNRDGTFLEETYFSWLVSFRTTYPTFSTDWLTSHLPMLTI